MSEQATKVQTLLTGATGLVGHYLLSQPRNLEITTLGRSDSNDIECDLTIQVPQLGGGYDLVIHLAGTEENESASELNIDGTRRLLTALDTTPPAYFIYLSSYKVYGKEEGEYITEQTHLWANDKAGQTKARAEEVLIKWCREHGTTLTILRPAPLFGTGMKSRWLEMAALVSSGFYFNIRQAEARRSILSAYDLAEVIHAIYPIGGIYNVADGYDHTLRELADAMGNNTGKGRRPLTLPYKWAVLIANAARFIPLLRKVMDSERLTFRTTSLTLDTTRLRNILPDFTFHDTVEIINRTEAEYPYEDD